MKKILYVGIGMFLAVGLSVQATSILSVFQGGTGVGTFTSSQLLYGNGTNALTSVATTSVSCSGNTTCTSFTAIGSSPITITSSGGSGGGGSISTSSPGVRGSLLYYTTAGATPELVNPVSTSSLAVGTGLTNSGTLGAQVGGTSASISFAAIAANSLWANRTGASAVPTAIATSTLGIAISDTTGTLVVNRGGTGAVTLTGCLTGNGTGAITGSGTCNTSNASVTSVGLTSTNSTLTVGSTPVTTSGTITADLNLGHSNIWSVLQSFSLASSSQFSAFQNAYFGATATSTFNSTGWLGIGTSTPYALLSVNAPAQTNPYFAIGSTTSEVLRVSPISTGSIFTVAATTSPSLDAPIKLFDVDQYGHLTASSTRATPTVSCTPSGGTISANSNDVTGDFTTGTLSTACTLTFANAYATTPEVMVGGGLTSGLTRSTTAVTFTLSAAVTGDTISYFIIQP